MDAIELDALKDGLRDLAKRAEANLRAQVEAGTLDFTRITPRAALLAEMTRIAQEDMANAN
jgi:hypothetical protein